jgi:hypothetical protein
MELLSPNTKFNLINVHLINIIYISYRPKRNRDVSVESLCTVCWIMDPLVIGSGKNVFINWLIVGNRTKPGINRGEGGREEK